MRKITKEAINAFLGDKNYKKGNTEVVKNCRDVNLYLHYNLIAKNTVNGIEVSLAGWNTPTTRERLNGIPGVSIHTCKGQAYLNGNPIEDNKFYPI